MKKKFLAFLSVIFFVGSIGNVAYATIELNETVEITQYIFEGRGEISSLDVNGSGDILICINPSLSQKHYITLFNKNGELIQTMEYTSQWLLSAEFVEDDMIALFLSRSPYVRVVDYNGELLYEYEHDYDVDGRKGAHEDTYLLEGVRYSRNLGKTKIIRVENGQKSILYEIKGEAICFVSFFAVFLILATAAIIFLLFYYSKAENREKLEAPVKKFEEFLRPPEK